MKSEKIPHKTGIFISPNLNGSGSQGSTLEMSWHAALFNFQSRRIAMTTGRKCGSLMSPQATEQATVTDLEVVDQMSEYGGNFARQLAAAFRIAEPMNRQRIKSAFPEIWSGYTDAATSLRRVLASSRN